MYHVFHICGPKDASKAGIGDYIINSANALAKEGCSASYISRESHGIDWSNEIEAQLDTIIASETPSGLTPIIHNHMAFPFCGGGVSPQFLDRYKSVVTIHELIELLYKDQLGTLDYLETSDAAVYTIQTEYNHTLDLIIDAGRDIDLKSKTTFIPVPAGIPEAENYTKYHPIAAHHTNDVAFFGMIRPGRGMEGTLVEFAKHLKIDAPNSIFRIVGSTVWTEVNVDEIDAILREITLATYPNHHADINNKSGVELVHFIKTLQKETPFNRRNLNVEFHFDIPVEEVVSVLSRCKFAYMPFERGATDHSSSLPSTVGLCPVTISTKGTQTKGTVDKVVHISESPKHASELIADFIEGRCYPENLSAYIEQYFNERLWINLALRSDIMYKSIL